MNSTPSFEELASAGNGQALQALAFMAGFYQNQPQASTAMEMDMDLSESVLPETGPMLSTHNTLNNILSETEIDPSKTSFAEIVFHLQRQVEDLETEMQAENQKYEENQRKIRSWCEQITQKIQTYRKKPAKKSPAASDM